MVRADEGYSRSGFFFGIDDFNDIALKIRKSLSNFFRVTNELIRTRAFRPKAPTKIELRVYDFSGAVGVRRVPYFVVKSLNLIR
nr:hypothetical protein [Ruegeria sp. HKCCD4884]